MIKQLSVFIENKPGRLAEVMSSISDAGINIYALSIADTTDFGILRLIVGDPEKAKAVMKSQGITVKTTDVIAVALEHEPGSLARVLRELGKTGASVEYMYASTSLSNEHDAMVIINLANQEEILDKVEKTNIKLIRDEDIRGL